VRSLAAESRGLRPPSIGQLSDRHVLDSTTRVGTLVPREDAGLPSGVAGPRLTTKHTVKIPVTVGT